LPLGPGEPESGWEFRRLATLHTFGDSWPRRGNSTRELFIHLEAYAGAARAFDSYQVAAAVFAEHI